MARTRKLESLGSLLARYKTHLKAPVGAVLDAFVVSAARYGIALHRKDCRYNTSSRTLSVTAPGPKKTEIYLNKKAILEDLLKELGQKNAPKDIV